MAINRSERTYAASWSPFEVLDLRLGPRPIGQGELAGVGHLDLLLMGPATRAAMRLARTLRRRSSQQPITGETAGPPSMESSAPAATR
jgi:hypothetical protein